MEVVVPRRMALHHVAPFVEEKRPWIERTLRRLQEAAPPVRLEHGGEVPYLGERLELLVQQGARPRVARRGHVLSIALPPGADLREALEGWYRRQARIDVAARLDAACARAGSAYRSLTIRNQKTRWASCSANGAMSFNWRLLLGPPEILDYVVEHEVAHLDVLDHSERFWSLLAGRCPDYREHERWLRRHGPALRL